MTALRPKRRLCISRVGIFLGFCKPATSSRLSASQFEVSRKNGSIVAVVSQAPGGALVDAVAAKRLLIGAALAMIAAGAVLIALRPRF
jgi:hypothetical protein